MTANRYVSSQAAGGGDGCSVGNPWTIQEAFTEATATAESMNVWIKNDGPYLLSSILTVAGNGSLTDQRYLRFIGYKDTPGDMDPGGVYSGSAIDAARAARSLPTTNPSAQWTTIDGQNGAFNLIEIPPVALPGRKTGIVFRNLCFAHTTGSGHAVRFTGSGGYDDHRFIRCRFEDVQAGASSFGEAHCLFYDCYSSVRGAMMTSMSGSCEIGFCIADIAAGMVGLSTSNILASHNLFLGGAVAARVSGLSSLLTQNVFYGQTDTCLELHTVYHKLSEQRNIFYLSGSSGVVMSETTANAIKTSRGSCAWSSQGALTTSYAGENGINADPQFVDPAGLDFRLRPNSPCWNLYRDMYGVWRHAGGIDQPKLFLPLARRAVYANPRGVL